MAKSKYAKLQEKLFLKPRSAWFSFGSKRRHAVFSFCDKYKSFLDESKTERESTDSIIKMAKAQGFQDLDSFDALNPGDKFFYSNKGKSVILGILGKELIFNYIGSHIDCPRIDLKPRPFYEDNGLALLKTHYYGGIRKYHWFNTPLALHGIIIDKNGNKKRISIGEDPTDPLFVISDLLPHLGRKREEQSVKEAFQAETMNLIIGNIPITKNDEVRDKIKLHSLALLHEFYGVTERDFVSAELELVPAGRARDIGIDRGLMLAYGQDDRSSSFASVKALFSSENTVKTRLAFFYDKEEVGSIGNTGANSYLIDIILEKIIKKAGSKKSVHEIASNSRALSADVVAALNPSFPDVHDPRNVPVMGNGVAVEKHTGYAGKFGGNDANAEYISFITRMLDKEGIDWQASELGKVDEGGGGTIALYIAKYGCEILDVGIPVIGMHAPYELISKVDLYSAYLAYKAFFSLA